MIASSPMERASALEPVDPQWLRSLREHVHERLRTIIVAGRFKEGERLNERELADMLGISVTPVKDALRMLEGEGLVRIEARRGVFVLFGPRRAYEMALARAAIEGVIAAIAARRIDPAARARLSEMLVAMDIATQRGILEEIVALNEHFHATISNIAACDYLHSRLDSQRMYDQERRLAVLGDAAERHTGFIEHSAIFAAISANQPEEAERRMRAHILRSARNFLNHVFSTGLEERDYVS
ncbi:GntR Transcriptional regulators [Rhabdaerophilaceae bacterium]